MASKTGRRANAAKKSNLPVEKDDGTRWIVVDENDSPIYLTRGGLIKGQAERLAEGLVCQATIKQVA